MLNFFDFEFRLKYTVAYILVLLKVLKNVEWPEQFPFKEEDFQRFDEYNLLNYFFTALPLLCSHLKSFVLNSMNI